MIFIYHLCLPIKLFTFMKFRALFRSGKPKTVLNFGCGTGILSIAAATSWEQKKLSRLIQTIWPS